MKSKFVLETLIQTIYRQFDPAWYMRPGFRPEYADDEFGEGCLFVFSEDLLMPWIESMRKNELCFRRVTEDER